MGINIGSILKKVVGAVTNPIGAASSLFDDVAKAIGSDDINDVLDAVLGENTNLTPQERAEVQQLTQEHELATDQAWQSFVLQHTGAAKDMPKSVQIIRALVRPFLSVTIPGLAAWATIYQLQNIMLLPLEKLELLAQLNNKLWVATLVVLGFWFGEKLITRTGLVDAFKKNK